LHVKIAKVFFLRFDKIIRDKNKIPAATRLQRSGSSRFLMLDLTSSSCQNVCIEKFLLYVARKRSYMVRNYENYKTQINENMRGGEGPVKIEHLLSQEELNNKGRLFAKITLKPGSSIGFHVHENEMESFYIINGEAEYDDNGEIVTLKPGDTTHTAPGTGHAIKNAGNTTLEMIALILFE